MQMLGEEGDEGPLKGNCSLMAENMEKQNMEKQKRWQ